jgi:1-acyl-sn-glycerol-3-phosphate acyltransferase
VRRAKGEPWLRFAVVVLQPLLTLLTRRDWRGGDNVPRSGGVVLVTNHISYFDPLAFAHFVWNHGRTPRFLAKSTLFGVPFVGRVVRGARQIPVYRESQDAARAFSAAVEAVRHGECVCVYPDGTVTRDPGLWPMVGKTGAARIALATGAPVVPVAQWGAHEVLPPYSKRLRLFPRRTMRLAAGPPVDLEEFRAQEPTTEILRAATDRIMADLTAQLEDIRGEHAPLVRFDPRAAGLPTTGDPRRAASHGQRQSSDEERDSA